MAKQTSLFGKISGKLGAVVFSTSGGQTVSREYNPNVANPSTQAQVNQRARMKLMSQLSAALSNVLAMQKDGLVSKRNKFVKNNFAASYANNGIAQITYENVQITEGNTALPALHVVTAIADNKIDLGVLLSDNPSATISRVVYCLFHKTDEGKLEYIKSLIVTERDTTDFAPQYKFWADFGKVPQAEYVVFAYGMSDTSEKATTQYGNLNVVTASDLARLIATRSLSYSDYQFTQTRAVTIKSDGSAVEPSTPGTLRVYVTAVGNGGTVSGGGSFEPGTQVTVVATPASGYEFVRWVYNGTDLTASTSASYTFILNQQVDLIAEFQGEGNDSL